MAARWCLGLNANSFVLLSVSNAAVEDLITAATTGILRHVATEEVSMERQRLEEEKRRAEEERWVCLVPIDGHGGPFGVSCSYRLAWRSICASPDL